MQCCSIPCADTNRFFSRLTGLYRWRFRIFGLEKTQRQLLKGILDTGIEATTLLEIGCGTGDLHHTLLQQGATCATGVDISENMLNEARKHAHDLALTDKTEYHLGDYVDLAEKLSAADITILDKVVCCYPDPRHLLKTALPNTKQAIALTYPRDRLFTRAAIGAAALLMKLFKSDFRPYVHKPEDIQRWISEEGFILHSTETVFAWQTEVYMRNKT